MSGPRLDHDVVDIAERRGYGLTLAARGLTFGYRADRPIVDRMDLSLLGGQLVALSGASGRGKSTLLYLLSLLLRPDAGIVSVNGLALSDVPDRRRSAVRAHLFGFVFQDAALDPSRSVIDNVIETAVYRGADRVTAIERGMQLLERFGVDVLPARRPGQVSGGQAQRIALARALHNDPAILFADEPTGNLDSASAGVVMDALREQADSGAIVVVATHDRLVLDACDVAVRL